MKKNGKIIVIVAPSGSGKSTLIKRLKAELPHLVESVSYTTRGKRPGEEHGTHYFYVTTKEFEDKIAQGHFLEWAKVHSNYYGTSKQFVEDKVAEGAHLLFDLDVQGTDAFKKYFKERAQVIFIAPPSVEELEKRLRGRGTETEEALKTRIENAKNELKRQHDYDHRVQNDELDRAYRELLEVVRGIIKG
jgi:guanylate kinase